MGLIKENPSLEFEAFVDQDQWQGTWQSTKPISIIPLCITFYGSEYAIDKVASALSENGVFLQEPVRVKPKSAYYNPHFLS